MVSFSCEACGDVFTKKKLDPHRRQCRDATFTCLDCHTYFPGGSYKDHTSCISEDQKYQGALYKGKDTRANIKPADIAISEPSKTMFRQSYVEEAEDESYKPWEGEYHGPTEDEHTPTEPAHEATTPPPEAPMPPSALSPERDPFRYLIHDEDEDTEAANILMAGDVESKTLVRFEDDGDDFRDPRTMTDAELIARLNAGKVQAGGFVTPAPKTERRRSKEGETKKTKKRKHLHLDIRSDEEMVDAPPMLAHSGLTGGLKSLLRPTLPPSPDGSGAEAPTSPLKKSRHSKHSKDRSVSNSLFEMLAASTRSKPKKAKSSKKSSRRNKEKSPQLIDYRPRSSDSKPGNGSEEQQLIVYKPRADMLMSLVNKGPESERGCSMSKALKRFHRERFAAGSKHSKEYEEKQLWKSLRLRKNDRGEIVVFTLDEEE